MTWTSCASSCAAWRRRWRTWAPHLGPPPLAPPRLASQAATPPRRPGAHSGCPPARAGGAADRLPVQPPEAAGSAEGAAGAAHRRRGARAARRLERPGLPLERPGGAAAAAGLRAGFLQVPALPAAVGCCCCCCCCSRHRRASSSGCCCCCCCCCMTTRACELLAAPAPPCPAAAAQAAAAAGHQRHAAGPRRAVPHAQRRRQVALLPAARAARRRPHAGRQPAAVADPGARAGAGRGGAGPAAPSACQRPSRAPPAAAMPRSCPWPWPRAPAPGPPGPHYHPPHPPRPPHRTAPQDQVASLKALGIPALALTSLTPKEQVNEVYRAMGEAGAGVRLLYVTPERVVSAKRFMANLEKVAQVCVCGGGGWWWGMEGRGAGLVAWAGLVRAGLVAQVREAAAGVGWWCGLGWWRGLGVWHGLGVGFGLGRAGGCRMGWCGRGQDAAGRGLLKLLALSLVARLRHVVQVVSAGVGWGCCCWAAWGAGQPARLPSAGTPTTALPCPALLLRPVPAGGPPGADSHRRGSLLQVGRALPPPSAQLAAAAKACAAGSPSCPVQQHHQPRPAARSCRYLCPEPWRPPALLPAASGATTSGQTTRSWACSSSSSPRCRCWR
jgi:hypothetical protein